MLTNHHNCPSSLRRTGLVRGRNYLTRLNALVLPVVLAVARQGLAGRAGDGVTVLTRDQDAPVNTGPTKHPQRFPGRSSEQSAQISLAVPRSWLTCTS